MRTMDKRSYVDGRLPKFFKVYLPDGSGDDLELPISFNSFLPKSLPKSVMVRSIYGNIWKMAFRKCCGDIERFVMVNGWKKIVKEVVLKGGEFLEFEFDGSWCFNFCVYGRETCKMLRSSVQVKEIEDVSSDGEGEKHSDDITVLDDENDDGVNGDRYYGDEDKSSENIIVLDDDTSDVQDYYEEDTSSEDATVLDDDISDVQYYSEEDTSSEDIIVIDDDDDDDENERRRGVKTEKGSFGEHDRQYLDKHMNPFFTVKKKDLQSEDLRIPTKVITNNGLHFPEFINLIDPLEQKFGKLKSKVEGQTIRRFGSIIRRNKVKFTDKVICELEKEMYGSVRKIKVHVIRG